MKNRQTAAEAVILFLLVYNPFIRTGNSLVLNSSSALRGAAYALGQAAVLLFFMFMIKKYRPADLGFLCPRLKDAGSAALLTTLLFAVTAAGRLILPQVNNDFLELSGNTAFILVPMLLVAAFGEELFFRAYLLKALGDVFGFRAAVAVSSLLFASGHIYQGFQNTVLIFVLGIVLCIFYRRTGSIAVNTAAHFLFNYIPLFLLLQSL